MFFRALVLAVSTVLFAGMLTQPSAHAAVAPTAAGQAVTAAARFDEGVTRLAGTSRYETALAISSRFASGVEAVFVATGTNFPDALSAAAAASRAGAPLLLTPPSGLPANVRDEIKRLAPKKIYVVGGTGAVGNTVSNALKTLAPPTRLGGADRYETSRTIIASSFSSAQTAILATGRTFPDALAATGAAGVLGAPVMLVDGTAGTIPTATVALLRSLGVKTLAIAGGAGAVSEKIASHAGALGFGVKRHGGATRYDTAAAINNAYFASGSTSTVFLATGTNFPDALAGAALAGHMGAPVFVTQAACSPAPINASIARLAPLSTAVLGGVAVVSDNAARNTLCAPPAANPKPTPPVTGPVEPIDGWKCPSSAPIKGNRNSWIYHVPGGAFYEKTDPEECFASETAAIKAGYRKSQR